LKKRTVAVAIAILIALSCLFSAYLLNVNSVGLVRDKFGPSWQYDGELAMELVIAYSHETPNMTLPQELLVSPDSAWVRSLASKREPDQISIPIERLKQSQFEFRIRTSAKGKSLKEFRDFDPLLDVYDRQGKQVGVVPFLKQYL
jgi:hypothetical protein